MIHIVGVVGALLLAEALTWTALALFHTSSRVAIRVTVTVLALGKAAVDVTLAVNFLYGGVDSILLLAALYILAHVILVGVVARHHHRRGRTVDGE